jgi:hypothetical protein
MRESTDDICTITQKLLIKLQSSKLNERLKYPKISTVDVTKRENVSHIFMINRK